MATPQVRQHVDAGALARTVAAGLLDLIADVQAAGRIPQIALTGGSIAEAIHRAVPPQAGASGVDWTAVDFWWGDERFVPADSPDRNAGKAHAQFLDVVGATRVHEIAASDSGLGIEEAAAAYGEQIRKGPGHEFDLVMLGMGPEGHVASLFPGRTEGESDRIAVAVHDSPKPPPERISLTFDALNHAQRVWFVITGQDKAATSRRAIDGDTSLPAARVHGRLETVWHLA